MPKIKIGPEKLLSSRQQKRKNKNPKTKFAVLPYTMDKEKGTINFSESDFDQIYLSVLGQILGEEIGDYQKYMKINHLQNDLWNDLHKNLEDLLYFGSPNRYRNHLMNSFHNVSKFNEAVHNFLEDPVAIKLDEQASGIPIKLNQYSKKLGVFRSLFVRKSMKRVSSQIKSRILKEYDRVATENYTKAKGIPAHPVKADPAIADQYYGAVKNSLLSWDRSFIAKNVSKLLEEMLDISKEGSPKMSYLFYKRLFRRAGVDLDLELRPKITQLMKRITGRPLFNFVYFMVSDFKLKGKLGLDDIVESIDEQEEFQFKDLNKFSRFYSKSKAITLYIPELEDYANLSNISEIDHKHTAELLNLVPIGQRKKMLETLTQYSTLINLYSMTKKNKNFGNNLIEFIVDSDKKINLYGNNLNRLEIVSNFADNESKRDIALWFIENHDVWYDNNLEAIIDVAESSQNPKILLNMYQQWFEYPNIQNIILENTKLQDSDFVTLNNSLKKLRHEDLIQINFSDIDSLLNPKDLDILKQKKSINPRDWIDKNYSSNKRLYSNLNQAYERLEESGLGYRLFSIQEYIFENYSRDDPHEMLEFYSNKIKNMPSPFMKLLMGDNDLFSIFLNRIDERDLLDKLKDTYSENSNNPYRALVTKLHPQIDLKIIHGDSKDDGLYDDLDELVYDEAGSPVRIVVLGEYRQGDKDFIDSRLNDPQIELVFVNETKKGTPPYCDGVVIPVGRSFAHSSPIRNFYENHGYITIKVQGFGNSALTRSIEQIAKDIRMNLRN